MFSFDEESVWDLDEDQFIFWALAAHPEIGSVGSAGRLRYPVMLDEDAYKARQSAAPSLWIESDYGLQQIIQEFKDKGLKGPRGTASR